MPPKSKAALRDSEGLTAYERSKKGGVPSSSENWSKADKIRFNGDLLYYLQVNDDGNLRRFRLADTYLHKKTGKLREKNVKQYSCLSYINCSTMQSNRSESNTLYKHSN